MDAGIYLHAELARLSNARDGVEYEAALTDAAARIQELVLNLNGGDDAKLWANAPLHARPLIQQIIERAISHQILPDGAVLRLWALPAVFQVSRFAQKIIEMPTDGLHLLRLTSVLHGNLQMADTGSWIHIFPVLLSDSYRQALPLQQLIKTPWLTKQSIRGRGPMPVFLGDDSPLPLTGTEVLTYSVPFVSYQPPSVKIGAGSSSPELTRRLTAWLASLADGRNGDISVRWVGPPRAFSQIIEDGYASWPPYGPMRT
ncbi:MAG TPA: hypothetical protein VLC92_02385 [Rhodocyclaceae bacterium]|nr:hypothetical protein [Rhodocyclaceae bacterium]